MKQFLRGLLLATLLPLVGASTASAQITGLNTFSPNTRILSADVNFNFTKIADESLRRTGGDVSGNITVANGVTIDGVDLSAWLDQNVKTTATPTFASLTLNGGLTAGSGSVGIIDSTGKIPALSSTYFADVSGTNLTGVAKLGSNNTFTNRNDFYTYAESRATPAISAGALTLDLSTATHFHVDLNANITSLTISNPVPSGQVGAFTIKFTADGTIRTITWPASVKWAGGTGPTMTGANGKRDFITCIYDDGGTNYFCTATQSF